MNEILHPTADKIAERLGVKRKTVIRWIKQHGLPAFQETQKGPYMITERTLCQWLNEFEKRHINNHVNR